MAFNASFDQIVATTLKNYRRKLADNITGQQALIYLLKERGYFEERDGGETIVEPLLLGENTTVASYSGWDILDISPQEGISACEVDWKQIAGSVTINGREEFQNSGSKTKIVSLLESKVKQLEISMRNAVNEQLFGDGTGNGGKDITGINLVVENGAAWSTYGGIDSNTDTIWRNVWLDEGGALDLASMRNVNNSCRKGKSRIDLIVTTQDIYEDYEALALANNEIVRTTNKLGDAGFENLEFKGIPMVYDEDCPTGTMLFLNSEYLKMIIGKGKYFTNTPFMRPDDQDSKVSQVLLYCNFVTMNRNRLGRLDGIT
jgi:hypothetical protein